jgi:hypothetical protein
MATQSSTILTAFNDHFMEFVNDIINVFPNDPDILSAKNSFMLIRKANPKMIIKIWHKQVVEKYEEFIDEGNITFFINKDYKDDLTNNENSEKITQAIDRLRNPVKLMTEEDQEKVMKYMKNLKKLSTIYISMN